MTVPRELILRPRHPTTARKRLQRCQSLIVREQACNTLDRTPQQTGRPNLASASHFRPGSAKRLKRTWLDPQ
jgi:hypothetical protein